MTHRRHGVDAPPAILACALGLSLLGCRAAPDEAYDLRAALEASAPSLQFTEPPATARVTVDGESRPAVLTTEAGFEWTVPIGQQGGRLHVGVQVVPELVESVEGIEVVVSADRERTTEILTVLRAAGGGLRRWLDTDADLRRFAGRVTRLRFAPTVRWKAGATRAAGHALAWSPVTLAPPPPPPQSTRRGAGAVPNVLVILVDTLRADHVGAYGYARATTPQIDRRLAQRGVLFERAYAQAPWTLPSVGSLFTGVQPGRFLSSEMEAFALPDDLSTLPELLAARGYTTAGFVANPTVHAEVGFARGFGTFYNPPLALESMKRDAEDLTPRIEAWLRAHQRRPFFLYAHYIDPHDPYLAPTLTGGRSEFLPDYDGPVTGDWIHGIYNGRLVLPDPARDIPQVVALYDSEIESVDRHVGRLLDALEPEVLARTLVVFTSDHGEELFDHGGWKHGQTLYDEQIRVPLVLRWDGRLEPGRRVASPVALLDVLPTIAAAAGVEPRAEWQGIDLISALQGGLPARRPIVSRHLASGPLRAAVVRGDQKLVLFNRGEPFAQRDPLTDHLWRLDLSRLRPAELYDLRADPREANDQLLGGHEIPAELASALHQELAAQGPGLRVVADGLRAGERAFVTMRFDRPPGVAVPYFLGPADRLVAVGTSVRLELAGDGHLKGMILPPPLPPIAQLSVGGLEVYTGSATVPLVTPRRVEVEELRAAQWPATGRRGLYVWSPLGAPRRAASAAQEQETVERLRALGYVN